MIIATAIIGFVVGIGLGVVLMAVLVSGSNSDNDLLGDDQYNDKN